MVVLSKKTHRNTLTDTSKQYNVPRSTHATTTLGARKEHTPQNVSPTLALAPAAPKAPQAPSVLFTGFKADILLRPTSSDGVYKNQNKIFRKQKNAFIMPLNSFQMPLTYLCNPLMTSDCNCNCT